MEAALLPDERTELVSKIGWNTGLGSRHTRNQPVGRGFRGSGESSSSKHLTLFLREFPLPIEILFSLFFFYCEYEK